MRELELPVFHQVPESQPLLVVFREPSPALVVLAAAGQSQVVPGLPPASALSVSGETIDVAGRVASFRESITTAAPLPRVVINEVLANAAGSEPGQEWIELVNDGSGAVDLAGYELADGGGSVMLPSRVLGPGAFVVLVSAAWTRCRCARLLGRAMTAVTGTAIVARSVAGCWHHRL